MFSRIWTIMRKEFIQIVRDPRTLAIMFIMPVMQLILLGYTATTNLDHIPTAVLDQDKSAESRDLMDTYRASNYFDINFVINNEAELRDLMDRGSARAGLIIPLGYARDLQRDHHAEIGFVIDGSEPNVANTALAAATTVGQAKSTTIIQKLLPGINPARLPGIEVRPRVWYNPELASSNYMIPALIGMILTFLTTFLTATAIVRERERGTIEQLIVTPLKSYELIVGKILPYVLIAIGDTVEVLVIGVLWFKVPVHGSLTLLFALVGLSLFSSLGLGLFISTVARTQQEAMLLAWFTMLPAVFLSGFFFPLEAMPWVLQAISYVIPLRYFLIISRGIILKGVGIEYLVNEALALAIFGAVLMTLAALRFRKRLE
jgi:ABC-2 type transport system permease protein